MFERARHSWVHSCKTFNADYHAYDKLSCSFLEAQPAILSPMTGGWIMCDQLEFQGFENN